MTGMERRCPVLKLRLRKGDVKNKGNGVRVGKAQRTGKTKAEKPSQMGSREG
jgi:hypothetical protein